MKKVVVSHHPLTCSSLWSPHAYVEANLRTTLASHF